LGNYSFPATFFVRKLAFCWRSSQQKKRKASLFQGIYNMLSKRWLKTVEDCKKKDTQWLEQNKPLV
jgi:hypothetical protein